MTAQQFYSEIWIKGHADDPRGDWPIRFAEAYHLHMTIEAGSRAESAPQEAGALVKVMLREFGTILAAEYDGEWGMYEMDGCECEEMLIRVGLIEKVKMQEACGENCSCAEYGEFPMDCNRTTELGKKALKLAERGVPLEETKNEL